MKPELIAPSPLFHVSEGEIGRFEPRPTASVNEPVVWAVDGRRLHNYLLPRDCPRVTFYAGAATTADDAERFLGTSPAVVAVESAWLEPASPERSGNCISRRGRRGSERGRREKIGSLCVLSVPAAASP